jgi:hypothetical protein
MKRTKYSSESGQAMVLIVVGMVVLLGFTALAIDGSMVYADRRFAQDGADAASLAGGATAATKLTTTGVSDSNWSTNSSCSNGNVAASAAVAKTSAIQRAGTNDIVIDQNISDSNGVATECGTEDILATKAGGGNYTLYIGHYMDIKTMVTHDTTTSFMHFVFQGPARNTVTAVTRIRPRQPLAYGFAVVALNPSSHCTNIGPGAGFHGNADLYVQGGGIFSNGCLVAKDNSLEVNVAGADVVYRTGLNVHSNDTIGLDSGHSINQILDEMPQDAYDVPVPDCTGHTVTASSIIGRTDLSGLYCVTGAMSINNSHESIGGTDLTLVFMGGKVTINGGTVNLQAPPANYSGPAIPGVAIYMPSMYYGPSCGDVNAELSINGNSGNVFRGTILAPCSDVQMDGNAEDFIFDSQLIGYNVNIGGTSGTKVLYNNNTASMRPARLDLFQ